jgi:hypothetical protein
MAVRLLPLDGAAATSSLSPIDSRSHVSPVRESQPVLPEPLQERRVLRQDEVAAAQAASFLTLREPR